MADAYTLNNYSDDAQIKRYISDVLMPRVFNDIPLNILNTGQFSIINEYMSQAIENLAFTASFYHNESFITKAMLADSIYSEAAIFNIGYSYATPSCCNFMLELRIKDLMENATYNSDNGLYEFVLDKNTRFNLSNGSVYSLDYDILIQYKSEATATIQSVAPAWNVQYINMDQMNSVAVNKDPYILYRVTETWLCLFVKASEYVRETHIVVNNMTNGIPNEDALITCTNHIAGFDIKYIDGSGNEEYIPHDHILPIHSDVKDQKPYVHYIMDSPKTIRFMFQLNGTRYFVPKLNSSYEITVYTCHGEAANFYSFKTDEQPGVITSSSKYSNNGNVMKAAFVMSPSLAGTNIGTIETTRRETIEAYNTANVISSDHDIEEWFNTFFFKNVLYPYFFKRRDDPWGRIWSGFIALKDAEDVVFRTNTLHAKIPYQQLYSNDGGTGDTYSTNEIIIPPGLVWLYTNDDGRKYTVEPLVGDNGKFETAKTSFSIDAEFIFANPFGIRIQKDPFAIGYFNPWINTVVSATNIPVTHTYTPSESDALIYHATPTLIQVTRDFVSDYYKMKVIVSPSTVNTTSGTRFVDVLKTMISTPSFNQEMWNYFQEPSELYEVNVPVLVQNPKEKYLIFDPAYTYMCVRNRDIDTDDVTKILLSDFWIETIDPSTQEKKTVPMRIQGYDKFTGTATLWGDNGVCMQGDNPVYQRDDTTITIDGLPVGGEAPYEFVRRENSTYYELRLRKPEYSITSIRVASEYVSQEKYQKYNEPELWRIGVLNRSVSFTIVDDDHPDGVIVTINNAQFVDIPYGPSQDTSIPNVTIFDLSSVQASDDKAAIVVYAEMKPVPSEKSILYTRVPFSTLLSTPDKPMFTMVNTQIPLENNTMRVLLETRVNGNTNGWLEMIPSRIDSDGSVEFEAIMNPLNKLIGADNRIRIASTERGGGAWNPTTVGGDVVLDAIEPDIQISILFKSEPSHPSEVLNGNPAYTGYRLQDVWKVNDLSLIQELKEMRSVVKFGENKIPSQNELDSYNTFLSLYSDDANEHNLRDIQDYAFDHSDTSQFATISGYAADMMAQLNMIQRTYSRKYKIKQVQIVDGGSEYGNEPVRIIFANGTTSKGAFLVDGYDDKSADHKGSAWSIVPMMGSTSSVHTTDTGTYTVDYEDIDWEAMTNGDATTALSTSSISGIGTGLTVSIQQDDVTIVSSIPSLQSQESFRDLTELLSKLANAISYSTMTEDDWARLDSLIGQYPTMISTAYENTSVNSAIEIQLVPFVQHTLMNSEKFDEFVNGFTNVHKAIEPVIFKRLEGNNYLDCKLIATYGKPHSYASDVNKKRYEELSKVERETPSAAALFWPSLDVQLEFDVHLFNPAMETITFKEIRNIIKSYFNRLTSIHTPVDMVSMDNNIYISQLIQQLESHPNVAYLKFKGWYTDEKGKPHSNYMNADYQCIVQMWDSIEDFPTQELERYIPEMFVLDDASIILNSI